jgi:hypothetical protein
MTLEEINQKRRELQEIILSSGKQLFQEEAKKLFDKYSGLESFGWCQWTMNFNDGEPCTFDVYTDEYCVTINGVTIEDMELNYDDKKYSYIYSDSKDFVKIAGSKELAETLYKDIHNLIESFPYEILELFDEGEITVSRDLSIDCKYVDHD